MRRPDYPRTESLGFNMTPMIDVVFLLIIFFLLSSHMVRHEVHLELPLPGADSGNDTDDTHPRVVINLLADGQIMLAGATVDKDELTRRLKVEIDQLGHDAEIRIRSDRHVPYYFVEPIMIACTRAGAWNVTFAVVRREEL